ncbi:pantetheine-phosphate adenylyltransferase [uncultured Faecalibaculum sp.]|uniref:pantetheine-phosphate adenylyltransferase n=1 Tax=uncultured Faecalibaculum sp. TaxID=1729681 RepID=UPI002637F17C|nr:pantetheine-phosphate adenylyltransferase [uncultured Faecalibaculum sp.]
MKAVFCGTFDPVTRGHLALIQRAAGLFDHLCVVISPNSDKHCLLSADLRRRLLEESVAHLPNVSVMEFDGLAVDAARAAGAGVLVRGLRSAADADYECNMAGMNRRIAQDIETLVLFSAPEDTLVSSSNVRELLKYGLPVDDLVPVPVNRWLQENRTAKTRQTHDITGCNDKEEQK